MAAQHAGLVFPEWIRIPSDACGQENSIWIPYVWTGKFFNPERKSRRLKNIRIRVARGLRESWRGQAIRFWPFFKRKQGTIKLKKVCPIDFFTLRSKPCACETSNSYNSFTGFTAVRVTSVSGFSFSRGRRRKHPLAKKGLILRLLLEFEPANSKAERLYNL